MFEAIAICIDQASEKYNVPVELVQSILEKEGGGKGVSVKNKNGTEDLGWAQINTVWLKELNKYGIGRYELLNNPCINIGVSSWILRGYYEEFGNWYDAISAYNAGYRLKHGRSYAKDVIAKWEAKIEGRFN